MSTKSTLALIVRDHIHVHLYEEMHDQCVYLQINRTDCHSGIEVVIPPTLVDALRAILQKAETP